MPRPAPRGRGKGKFGKDGKKPQNRGLFRRRKFCRFTAEKIKQVDYKDIAILNAPLGFKLLIPTPGKHAVIGCFER
jgi:hypothetical protein